MKSTTSNQSLESAYLPFSADGRDPLLKPMTSSCKCHGCSLKTLLKRVGVLLIFHILNIAVAIGGVIFSALMIASMALMPVWVINWFLLMTITLITMYLASLVPQRLERLQYLACLVPIGLLALHFYMVTRSVYTCIGAFVFYGAGAIGVGLFHLSIIIMKWLVRADAHLANFAIPSNSTQDLQPEVCANRFAISKSDEATNPLPHVRMTCRTWLAVLYFAIPKVFVGVLSAAVVAFAIILPAIALFSGGEAGFFGSQITFHDNPALYVVIIASIWLFGAVGMVIFAILSVKLTSQVCGEWHSKDEGATERNEPAVPSSTLSDSSTICSSELDMVV